jgi:hypothetical protein
VGCEKHLSIKRSFSGSRYACEDDGLHFSSSQLRTLPSGSVS